MNTYDFVHLVLNAAGGKISGRTKLQKTVYFTGAIAGCLDRLGYRAHYYGPYSSEVTAAVDELRGLGFLSQHVSSSGAVNAQGFEIARYDYELTEVGKLVAEEKAVAHPIEWKGIQAAFDRMKAVRDVDYVRLSIAAKSYFLQRANPQPLSPEELSRRTSPYGWQVSPEQFREADTLLKSLNLTPPESAS